MPPSYLSLDRWMSSHPLLAERACLALCRVTARNLPDGFDWLDWVRGGRLDNAAWAAAWRAHRETYGPWRPGAEVETTPQRSSFMLPMWSRSPPLPGAQRLYGPDWKSHPRNICPVCLCRTYAGGDWRADAGAPRWNKCWHAPCFAAHTIWADAGGAAYGLAQRQDGRCPITGAPLFGPPSAKGHVHLVRGVQVDHIKPLWRVRLDAAVHPWPDVLRFWGPSNLQALSPEGHKIKTRQEAAQRATLAKPGFAASNEDEKVNMHAPVGA